MKLLAKTLVALFWLPWFALAGIIAITRLMWVATIEFSWTLSDEWYGAMLEKLNAWIQRLKSKP